MKLSNRATKLLRWMNRHDKWVLRKDLQKAYKRFDDRSFQALAELHAVDFRTPEDAVPEVDDYGELYFEQEYRINDAGRAYLEELVTKRWGEIRAWVTLAIAIAAFALSVISLILQYTR